MLNLPIKSQAEDWIEFFDSGTVIALHPAKRKTKISNGVGVLVGFMINDFDVTINELKQENVKFFKERKQESFGKHAIIEDPDGHLISIAHIESNPAHGFDLLGLIGAD